MFKAKSLQNNADGFRQLPSILQSLIYDLGGLDGNDQFGRTRTNQLHAPIKPLSFEWFNRDEVIKQRDCVPSKLRFPLSIFLVLRTNTFTGLFGKRLSQSGCDAKPHTRPAE